MVETKKLLGEIIVGFLAILFFLLIALGEVLIPPLYLPANISLALGIIIIGGTDVFLVGLLVFVALKKKMSARSFFSRSWIFILLILFFTLILIMLLTI